MRDRILDVVTTTIARAPEWIRRDLLARDTAGRARAEEALAAMITAALDGQDKT